ncbi:MAG TPA: hypothetical protein VNN15_09370 [Solirubrobacterales bacterium]|nr:hypothetical protein [Solirubrobacterales bacterium]
MNELVHWILHNRLISSVHWPSFAGSGLPERMRSTAFALLGLTAAAGLVLVAIFAQLSFPLLEPAPLPAEPTASESIGAAEKVALDRGSVAVVPARPAPSAHFRQAPPERSSSNGTAGAPPASSQTGGATAPAPAVAPESSSGNKNGGGGAGGEPGGGSNPAPTAAPPPAPAPSPAPAPAPTTVSPAPIASEPAPEPVAPGNSSSAAAAEHASERGVEASSVNGPDK